MAKKNLTSLVSGFIGNENKDEEAQIEIKVGTVSDTKTKKGPGRPKKIKEGGETEKTTFVGDRQLIRKLKFIAILEDCLLKDVIDDAFKTYIEHWEKENGAIPVKQK